MPDKHTNDICPYCQHPIELGQPVSVCPECRQVHHMDCWNEYDGCAGASCAEFDDPPEPWYSLRSIGLWCLHITIAAVIGITFASIWSFYRPKPPAITPITPPEVVITPNHPAKLISRKQWGDYQIVIDELINKCQRLRVMKGKKVIDELREAKIWTKVVSISAPSSRELEVCLWSGGSAQHVQYVYLSQKIGLRRILQLCFAGGVYEHRDMNHDGRQEIILGDRCLEGYANCNASIPGRIVVIGWDHDRFVDRTKYYHRLVRPDVYDAQSRLVELMRTKDSPNRTKDDLRWDEIDREQYVMQYLLTAAVAGEADIAYRWIMKHTPFETRRWTYGMKEEIIDAAEETDVDIKNLGNSPGSYPMGELIDTNALRISG